MPVNTSITFRKGSSSQWSTTNPVLASGEPGYDLTNNILKIGDGVSNWNNLSNITSISGLISASSGNFNSLSVSGVPVSISGHTHFGDEIVIESDDFNSTTLSKGSVAAIFLEQMNNDSFTEAIDNMGGLDYDGVWLTNKPTLGTASAVDTTYFSLASHTHGNITNSGAIGSTSGLLVITGNSGVLTTTSGISSSYITNFNSSVSGLLPVTNILGGSNITVSKSGTDFTIAVTGSLGLTTEEVDDRVSSLLVAGTGINLTYNDSSNQLILSSENYYGANRGIIEVSSAASSFNIPGGYTVGGFDLFLNGVKLVNDVDFIATNGNNISTAYPIPSGSVLEYISLTLANPLRIASDQYSAEISREIISVTGTLSTINIIGGYDSGGLDVYKDGLKLIKDIQYTANNGSSISLATPAASGSIIEYVSFLAGKARRSLNTITSSITAGAVPQTDYVYVATSPNITVTIPSAIGNNNRYTIKNLSSGTINVVPQNGQTIDNQPTIAIINQYISIDLVSDNQNWIII